MHSHFYHWHSRAEPKPDVSLLEARWQAAVKFSKGISSEDLCHLLQLVVSTQVDANFASKFSEALVKEEPTFPPSKNDQLLRVMATASAYNWYSTRAPITDAVALGLYAASDYLSPSADLVTDEVLAGAVKYLESEAEMVRSAVLLSDEEANTKKIEAALAAIKKGIDSNNAQEIGAATQGAFTELRESFGAFRAGAKVALNHYMEESQFLWWVVGRRSSQLKLRRSSLDAKFYAAIAAQEAIERVQTIPPPASAESLLEEVLTQCGKQATQEVPLWQVLNATELEISEAFLIPALTPMMYLIKHRPANFNKKNGEWIETLGFDPKRTTNPIAVSQQFFREFAFLEALEII